MKDQSWLESLLLGPQGPTGPAGQGALVFVAAQVTAATYTIAVRNDVRFNTSLTTIALSTPAITADGDMFRAGDGAGQCNVNVALLTDPNGYLFQNPLDDEFYAAIQWGTGSGGLPAGPGVGPNLGNYKTAVWCRTTSVVAGVSRTFFQCVGAWI